MTIGIRLKIVLITTSLLFFTISSATILVNRVFIRSFSEALVLQASGVAHGLKLQLDRISKFGIHIDEIVGFDSQCREVVQEHQYISFAQVTDINGTILFHNNPSAKGAVTEIPRTEESSTLFNQYVKVVRKNRNSMNTISVPVTNVFGRVNAWVQVGYPGWILYEQIRPLWIQSALIAFLAIFISSILSYFSIGKSIVFPLSELVKTIDHVDNYGTEAAQLIPINSKDEIGRLTQSFNKMIRTVQRTNREILGYATRLEEKVEERTLDLLKEIEERKKAEKLISNSLKEKEVLLKEIHHRVKNNLQVISSLLSLQANSLSDENSRVLFHESMNRVKAMALIHEKLYQSTDISSINFRDYTNSLLNELIATYHVSLNHIQPVIEVEDIGLDIDMAIPCGLIINELISNSFKYAFPKELPGKIRVTFTQNNNGHYILTVQDDGIGFPGGFNFEDSETLGLRLVKGLVEEQLDGEIAVIQDRGTEFRIIFPV